MALPGLKKTKSPSDSIRRAFCFWENKRADPPFFFIRFLGTVFSGTDLPNFVYDYYSLTYKLEEVSFFRFGSFTPNANSLLFFVSASRQNPLAKKTII
jgi:hypothetical protein